ncbi:hypothetical protein R3P38DRAFT_2423941, partial [Favolaschia claudopus]
LYLSTAFDNEAPSSLLSLDWVLSAGVPTQNSVASGTLVLPQWSLSLPPTSFALDIRVSSSLPYDLVLGQDWAQYCRDSALEDCFALTTGPVDL